MAPSAASGPLPQSSLRVTLELDGRQRSVVAGESVTVGRDPGNDLVVSDPLVSRRHLLVSTDSRGCRVEDLSSANGTWWRERPLRNEYLAAGTSQVRLGAPDGVLLILRVHTAGDTPARPSMTRVGRAADNDVVVDDPLASRHHLTIDNGVLVDHRSFNQTFVNGVPVTTRRLEIADRITVGNTTFEWRDGRLAPPTDASALVVRDLGVQARNGKVLLDKVSLSLPPASLTAVIGPSGAGKSTLLGALSGTRPAQRGVVHWEGQDLYASYEAVRQRIGLVPQQDIQHPQLKVRQALRYAARLRLPPDTTAPERSARVDEVVELLQLSAQAEQRIGRTLSGGQRKRVSIATELLTAPPLLYLDEPTSGLDPALDQDVMELLRRLADEGRIVLTVTHSVQALDLCDRVLVMAPGGSVAFFGPPSELFAFFEVDTAVGVFQQLARGDWSHRFSNSDLRDRFLGTDATPTTPDTDATVRSASWWAQARTLMSRTMAVAAADRMLLALIVVMPVLLALLAHVVPGDSGLSVRLAERGSAELPQRLTILIVGAALMGLALTVRELVRERSILSREHAVGLSLSAYWWSKVLVFGAISLGQGLLFGALALLGVRGPDGTGVLGWGRLEIVIPVAIATAALAVTGLVISSLVRSSEQAMPALVGTVMVQLVLSGALLPISGRSFLEYVAWLSPARWAYVASSISTNVAGRGSSGSQRSDPLYHHDASQWLLSCVVLFAVLGATALLGQLLIGRSVRRGD